MFLVLIVRASRGSKTCHGTKNFWDIPQHPVDIGWHLSGWPNTRSLAQKPQGVFSRVMTFIYLYFNARRNIRNITGEETKA